MGNIKVKELELAYSVKGFFGEPIPVRSYCYSPTENDFIMAINKVERDARNHVCTALHTCLETPHGDVIEIAYFECGQFTVRRVQNGGNSIDTFKTNVHDFKKVVCSYF